MTALTGPRRVSHIIYEILMQQQRTLETIERNGISAKNVMNVAVINQSNPQSIFSVLQDQLSDIKPAKRQSTQVITKPTKLLPWTVRFDRWCLSVQVVALPRDESTSYRAAAHVSLFARMYSVQLDMSFSRFSFDRMLHVCNIVPVDSEMTVACKTGDFESAQRLLQSGSARGSDMAFGGRPMLDVSENLHRPGVQC